MKISIRNLRRIIREELERGLINEALLDVEMPEKAEDKYKAIVQILLTMSKQIEAELVEIKEQSEGFAEYIDIEVKPYDFGGGRLGTMPNFSRAENLLLLSWTCKVSEDKLKQAVLAYKKEKSSNPSLEKNEFFDSLLEYNPRELFGEAGPFQEFYKNVNVKIGELLKSYGFDVKPAFATVKLPQGSPKEFGNEWIAEIRPSGGFIKAR
jgi:hypothetical protein